MFKKSNTNNKSEFIAPSKDDCLKLIKTAPSEWNKLKSENPDWIPNLDGVDFENINLSGIDLRNCSLKNTDFSKTINLQEKNIGGSDLDEARLPERFEFTGLSTVKEISTGASTIFIMTIVLCFYCWITVVSTNDLSLLTNSGQSILPFINISLPIIGFYLAAPLILLAFYIYFHLNLKKLWYELSELPAYFPDGKSIEQKTYPWLINDFVSNYMCLLRKEKSIFLKLQNKLIVILAWGIVPLTVFIIWGKYLINHEMKLSFVHSVVLSLCLAFGIIFFQNARTTVKCNSDTNKKLCNFKCLFGISLIILFSIFFISVNNDFGFNVYSLDNNAEIIKKPVDWKTMKEDIDKLKLNDEKFSEKLNDILGPIKISIFKKRNFKNIRAERAFLVNADLTDADLQNADLDNADIQNATLSNANLTNANLAGADLKNTCFYAANLKNANLDNASLQYARFFYEKLQNPTYKVGVENLSIGSQINTNFESISMQNADLEHAFLKSAQLQDAKLNYSNLQYADLSSADLTYAWLKSVDFQYANLSDAILRDAYLDGAQFQHAILADADLDGASLYKTNLKDTDLTKTYGLTYDRLRFAIINENTKLPKELLKDRKKLLKIQKKIER